jgi:hypothetical protein
MDANHESLGFAANITPAGYLLAAPGAVYDWEASEYQVPNDPAPGTTTGYHIHAIGPSTASSKGMIAGYAASRARPQQEDPNLVEVSSTEGWMRELFDVGDNLDEIRENIEDLNDQPPYLTGPVNAVEEYYPGGAYQATTLDYFLQDTLITRPGTSAVSFDSTGTFLAPCGLLRLSTGSLDWSAISFAYIYVTLAPGPVKGLMAQPMQEMN